MYPKLLYNANFVNGQAHGDTKTVYNAEEELAAGDKWQFKPDGKPVKEPEPEKPAKGK